MTAETNDFFIEHNGERYAVVRLNLELWGAEGLDDLAHVAATLRDCVKATGVPQINIFLPRFTPYNELRGAVMLKEPRWALVSPVRTLSTMTASRAMG